MTDLRVGIIGTDNTHGHVYSGYINGWSHEEPIPTSVANYTAAGPTMYRWAATLRELELESPARVPIPGARVTRLWSADRSDAERIARACDIETICDEPSEVVDDVDAVMVCSEDPATHLPFALPALERGLPTMVDKPVAEDLETGRRIFEAAEEHGAPCFTGSGLRYATELLTARDAAADRIGKIVAVYVSCPLTLRYYGIHAVEMVNVFLGSDVTRVRGVRGSNRETVHLEFASGQTATIENINALGRASYHVLLFGQRGDAYAEVTDIGRPLLRICEGFVDMARGGPVPIPPSEGLHLNAIVFAAEEALRRGEEIALPR